MTRKELRRLSRTELLEILLDLTEDKKKLEERLQTVEESMSDRIIVIKDGGSYNIKIDRVQDAENGTEQDKEDEAKHDENRAEARKSVRRRRPACKRKKPACLFCKPRLQKSAIERFIAMLKKKRSRAQRSH